MLVYHDFRGDIASQIGTHARAKSKQPGQRVIVTRPTAALKCRLGLRRVQKECQCMYQRHNKALVLTLTRFIVRRAPVAPLRLASKEDP